MKLNVEIDSGAFEKVISDGIKALSPEEMAGVLKQVMYEAFVKCEDLHSLLLKKEQTGWNQEHMVLGPLGEAAIKRIDLDNELAEFKANMVKALMDNHQRIVEDMFMKCFIDRIVDDSDFRERMRFVAQSVLYEAQNR